MGLSAETFPRISFEFPHRRPSSPRRHACENPHRAPGIRHHSLCRRHFHGARNFFVPVDAQGAVILLDVETEQPLEVEAVFHRDFQLMWPAALAASYLDLSSRQHAFYFGEEQGKFVAYVGSPTATDPRAEFQNNYSESQTSSFRL